LYVRIGEEDEDEDSGDVCNRAMDGGKCLAER